MVNCLEADSVFDVLNHFGQLCVPKSNLSPSCFAVLADKLNKKQREAFKACVKAKRGQLQEIAEDMTVETPNSRSFITINDVLYHG